MRFTVQRYRSVPSVADSESPIHEIKSPSSTECIMEGAPPVKSFKVDGAAIGAKNIWTTTSSSSRSASPAGTDPGGSGGSGVYGSESPDCSVGSGGTVYGPVAQRGREFAKRQRERLVNKTGEMNISQTNVKSKNKRFFIDIFTTAVDMQWRYNLLMFGLGFVCSWLGFALVWWIICIAHGDHLKKDDPEWVPCVAEVFDFQTALLFSIETQHTIGYGSRSMMPKCPEAFIVLMMQSCFGVFVQSLMTGIIFAKLSRPKRRAQTIMFSKMAVICQRDGIYCLLFRVADMRKSYIVDTMTRAIMVKNRLTKEGEVIPLCQYPLHVETESSLTDSYAFLACPVTVMHRINEESPLWDVSAEELLSGKFEIIVILEGTIESTGMMTQVRTSYLPSEILWGHRLAPLLTYQKENGQYKIDYGQFHQTVPTTMPECSAKQYAAGDTKSRKTAKKREDFPFSLTAPGGRYKPRSSSTTSIIRRVLSLKRRREGSPPCSLATIMANDASDDTRNDVPVIPNGRIHRSPSECFENRTAADIEPINLAHSMS